MFTGLIESIGEVKRVVRTGNYLEISITTDPNFADLQRGESIAVSGACLTVTSFDAATFTAEASQETTRLTTLGALTTGDRVNLERAMRADGRLGGHLVAGHVDRTLKITKRQTVGQSLQLSVELPDDCAAYVIDKGSIALDGVSLTIIHLDNKHFTVNLIPESQSRTTLPHRKVGDNINVEFDLVGKYILRSAGISKGQSSLTIESMRNMGY